MKIFLTCLPAFYKTNLYNEIAKKTNIAVLYINNIEKSRNEDFFNGEKNFEFHFLPKSLLASLTFIYRFLKSHKEYEVIMGGWDELIYWFIVIFSPRRKNSLALESSVFESNTKGIKGTFKRFFVSRVSIIYASGRSQERILANLSYKGRTIITQGVGLFNYHKQPKYCPRKVVRNFIFVGRLIDAKNLHFLIDYFNKHLELNLFIVGFGKLERELREMSNENIHFMGAINNKDLSSIYQSMDVFILPSKSESWGVVVEEALNNGLPVLVSNRVGCAEEILNSSISRQFIFDDSQSLEDCINEILNIDIYNDMRLSVSKLNFEVIESRQVDCYL